MNKILLRLEGLSLLLLSVYCYSNLQFSWLLFFLLLLAPDLSMLGYLVDKKTGAALYNIFHTHILSIGVIFIGLLFESATVLSLGLILCAHIGMDRMLGFGLKYPTGFKDTHFNRV